MWERAEAKAATARAIMDDRRHCHEAWFNAGTAVEFALKALIMRRERLNSWPSGKRAEEI
jgi:HEPN domain-containing protein